MKISFSMGDQRMLLTPGHFAFRRREAMRFEWLALLGYMRKRESGKGGWVSMEDIRGLPLWKGKSIQHVGTNVGRYIHDLEKRGVKLVEAKTQWRGPYRLSITPEGIRFDVPIEIVGSRLGRTEHVVLPSRRQLYGFTEQYARASSLFMEGYLTFDPRLRAKHQESALGGFSRLARSPGLDSRLRLLAQLRGIEVLDRLGRYEAVAERLADCEKLAKRVADPVVVARFYLINARRYLRTRDDALFQENLALAKEFSAKSPDSQILGESAEQEGVYLLAADRNKEALRSFIEGVNTLLPTDNFEIIQASCFNIGNALQRIGERYYAEAEEWLELCTNITSLMHLGRYEALAEIILAKMAVELRDDRKYLKWIEMAEEITDRTHNTTDLMWCNLIRAMYEQRKGNEQFVIDHLVKARKIYLVRGEFDRTVPEKYLRRKFPDVWEEVVQRSGG
jgi:tetratricopeptide (TPR) repeat protein